MDKKGDGNCYRAVEGLDRSRVFRTNNSLVFGTHFHFWSREYVAVFCTLAGIDVPSKASLHARLYIHTTKG